MSTVRPAAVAGLFYPAGSATLAGAVAQLLATAQAPTSRQDAQIAPKALIAPHAGYIYSGPMAAQAYAALAPAHDAIRRVVLLGPAHRVPVRGLALPGVDAFATPLGSVPLDAAAVASLRTLPQVDTNPAAHAQEHALEVHLPFLQSVLDAFTLVPLVVGDATSDEVAEVLHRLWGGPETLIVISSDLSHYHPYREAQALDQATVQHILGLQTPLQHPQACGATPINGLLQIARARGLRPELLGLCNSGDTAGDKGRVVGYTSILFHENPTESPDVWH